MSTYSQLSIIQKINFKGNAVAYGKAFSGSTGKPIMLCRTVIHDLPLCGSDIYPIVYSRHAKGGYYPKNNP